MTMRRAWLVLAPAVASMAVLVSASAARSATIDYVIHISVDGLRPDAITNLGPTQAPNFYRMRTEGAFTDNARCDYDISVTLPNHTTQLTGRRVTTSAGHNWTSNSDPAPGTTLATNKGSYVAGVCDVAHDNGLRTGLYVSKTKFSLFDVSWNETNGAPDTTGPDNGRDKVDTYAYSADTAALTASLVADMTADPFDYTFLHLMDPDSVGHASGWNPTPGSVYSDTIKTMDVRLGEILSLVENDTRLADHTIVIMTADHGGYGTDHSDATRRENYTIPFYVWGPGVPAGADLYALNPTTRKDPGLTRPVYSLLAQPIRNGDVANLALDLLRLGPVPGSGINVAQDLYVPEPASLLLAVMGGAGLLRRRRRAR